MEELKLNSYPSEEVMKKSYCRKCKWRCGSHSCEYPNPDIEQQYQGERVTLNGTTYELNKHGNCSFYKKAWWKI